MKISILIKIKGILNMNKLLVATLLLIGSGLSHADQSGSVSNDDKELCGAASYFAGMAFEGHQNGEDKKAYLKIINDDDDRENGVSDI